jgi:hypothetical protein
MPVNMAMKECNTRIIGLKSYDCITVSVDEESVATHWRRRECWIRRRGEGRSLAGTRTRAQDYLNIMRVYVERMCPAVEVNYCELDDATVGDDERVCIYAVDCVVIDKVCRGAESCVERGDLWLLLGPVT